MNLNTDKVTEILYLAEGFCIQFDASISRNQIGSAPKRKPRMSTSEVITLKALFHSGSFRYMKHYYIHSVQEYIQSEFPQTVSYNRFTELMQSALLPMAVFLKTCSLGDSTVISFIDSTSIRISLF